MVAAVVCREYGWTYEEYQDQPLHFIHTITTMLEAETAQQKKDSKNK